MVFLMYDIYISYMYYQFCLSQMGKKWFLWMSHYHARYKSEEISPSNGYLEQVDLEQLWRHFDLDKNYF